MLVRRPLLALAVAATAALTACGAATEPAEPTVSPTPVTSPSPTPTESPSVQPGLTLRQLGFENGPAEFSIPKDAVISTSVDQPNAVTIVLARPSPRTVEDYLRATLPDEGFTIDATAVAGSAMEFKGHGWRGGFTGTAATSAIVLRPA